MLSIYAPIKYHDFIHQTIQQEHRLDELITVIDYLEEKPVSAAHNLVIKQDMIWPMLDWFNSQPPIILPENVELTDYNLLGILFAQLDNYEKVYFYLSQKNPGLYAELDILNRLKHNLPVDHSELSSQYSPYEEYRLMHNQAILSHYTSTADNFDLDRTAYFYSEAIKAAPSEEHQAFTALHLSALLIDLGKAQRAEGLLKAALSFNLEPQAKTEIKAVLCQAWMHQLAVPYDEEVLKQLKQTLWEVLKDYEKQNRQMEAAMIYVEAGTIANYSESWAESLSYFNKALVVFEKENSVELIGNIHFRKGILFSTWAQNGNPQFYRSAAECFQEAVAIFTRDKAPEIYADIQHQLGRIYAEIPDEAKKKSIWAAVSSSAFSEALDVYKKDKYPYEYAAVCNHYGNALTMYPEARLSDNLEKALYYYQEALDIRVPHLYPMEYCLTALNYLEAQWHRSMPEDKLEEQRYDDMLAKAIKIKEIAPNAELKEAASLHLERLELLKTAYA